MKRRSVENEEEMARACRELYIKYRGKKHRQIEAEMRSGGWPQFNRRLLYTNVVRGIEYANWIERFGWKDEVERLEREAELRETGRTTFEDWLQTEPSGLRWTARHHAFICEHLRRITEGTSRRLMIFLPPRHGKSELVTVRYIAWRLIRNARINVIIGSYNQRLANRFSRKIKQLTTGRVIRSHQRHAAEEWETAVGGSVKAVGVGAGITGFGGDLIIIDDPVKGRAVANSRTFREKMWDWYRDDISTRLEPHAPIILIQTRWHDDDLAGRLLKEMNEGGEQWEVIRLPALAEAGSSGSPPYEGGVAAASAAGVVLHDDTIPKSAVRTPHSKRPLPVLTRCHSSLVPRHSSRRSPHSPLPIPQSAVRTPQSEDPLGRADGEALWPGRFDSEELLAARRRLGTRSFDALYQQRPHPEGGTIFRVEWFTHTVAKHPDGLRWFRGYDLAASVKTSADYTASFRVALDKRDGKIYIADGFRKRIEFPDQRRYVLDRMAEEPDTVHCIEEALHGKALVQDLRRNSQAIGRTLRGVRPEGDKLMRAEAWAPYAEEGRVVLVSGPWIAEFIDEVCRFTGKGDAHDDQVDAVSLAVQAMNIRKGFNAY
ncbi:MAG: phage terminase large subunit [Chloracidobacterium sp.]|nr:phage terminase large subunit [Chloracidobacterium sp.]